MFTADDIRQLIAYGASESTHVPEQFMDGTATWRKLMCGDRPWIELAKSLGAIDLASLIKGLVLLGAGPLRGAGSVSPAIPVYRVFRERFPAEEPDLTSWIVDHRSNPAEPFGTGKLNDARSYESFVLTRALHEAAIDARMAEQQRIAAARRAEHATTKLPDAIRRGDASAVEALLAKGADAMAAAAMAGMPLSELAAKQGRSAVLILLRERGVP